VLSRTAASGDGRAIPSRVDQLDEGVYVAVAECFKGAANAVNTHTLPGYNRQGVPANCRYGTRCRGSVLGGYLARTLSEPR